MCCCQLRIICQPESDFECGAIIHFHHHQQSPLIPLTEPFVERNIKGLLGGHVFALRGTQTQ